MVQAKANEDESMQEEEGGDIRLEQDLHERFLAETHRILKSAIDRAGPKRVAQALDVSLSLVYKWTQAPRTKDSPQASGARNPLDKLVTIFSLSDDLDLIHFVCRVAQGFYTPNPQLRQPTRLRFVTATVAALNDFADMMQFAEKSLTNDGKIDVAESKKLRKQWDRLKSRLEHFVVACEEGRFDLARNGDEDDEEEE